MPRRPRWFPVTHDINADPELWELRDLYGDRAALIWLEMLSIADRNAGLVGPDSDQTRNQLASKCRSSRVKVGLILDWCRTKAWLVSDNGLRIANYWKYHRTEERNQIPAGSATRSPPNQTEPDQTLKSKTLPNSVSVSDFTEAWNNLLGLHLPKIRLPLSPSRERKLRLRIKEHPQEDFWSEVFTAILKSDFLMGRNGNGASGWRIGFDWLIENDKNCLKIAEGTYANKH